MFDRVYNVFSRWNPGRFWHKTGKKQASLAWFPSLSGRALIIVSVPLLLCNGVAAYFFCQHWLGVRQAMVNQWAHQVAFVHSIVYHHGITHAQKLMPPKHVMVRPVLFKEIPPNHQASKRLIIPLQRTLEETMKAQHAPAPTIRVHHTHHWVHVWMTSHVNVPLAPSSRALQTHFNSTTPTPHSPSPHDPTSPDFQQPAHAHCLQTNHTSALRLSKKGGKLPKKPQNAYSYRVSIATELVRPRSARTFALWTVGISVASLFLAITLILAQVRPLKALAQWAKALHQHPTGPTPQTVPKAVLPAHTSPEIRLLAQVIQNKVHALWQEFHQRALIMMGLSHDLRTPLTRLTMQLSCLPNTEENKDMRQDVQQMAETVAQYLYLFQTMQPSPQAACLSSHTAIMTASNICDGLELLRTMVEQYQKRHPEKKWKLHQGTPSQSSAPKEHADDTCPPLALQLQVCQKTPSTSPSWPQDPEFFRCIMHNVLDNAARFAHHHIEIWVHWDAHQVHIAIGDDGPGICPTQQDNVFYPFVRLNPQDTMHTGLGLSIVQALLHTRHGKIWCQTKTPSGTYIHLLWTYQPAPESEACT